MNQRRGTRVSKQAGDQHNDSALSGAQMLSEEAWTAIEHSCQLSPRELQIVRGIFDNHTDHAIASSLGISRHTIHTYLSRLFRKLDATTRTQVVLRVMQQFLALSSSPGENAQRMARHTQKGRRADGRYGTSRHAITIPDPTKRIVSTCFS